MRILVAEDDAVILEAIRVYLEKHGQEVLPVGDGRAAAELLERETVDMVITDYNMPYLTGEDLVQLIQERPEEERMPVIIITAFPQLTKQDQMLKKGAAFYLEKPIDFEQLLSLVRFAEER